MARPVLGEWEMRFTGGRQIQRLEAGWRGFALDSGLRFSDGCVLELADDGKTEEGAVVSGSAPAGAPPPPPSSSTELQIA
jgi:hypothetical protein